MKFEWNSSKRIANLQKHGIDFSEVPAIFNSRTVTTQDYRLDYGEERFVTYGMLRGRVIVVVHTETDNCIRIISARKASKNERESYFE